MVFDFKNIVLSAVRIFSKLLYPMKRVMTFTKDDNKNDYIYCKHSHYFQT